MATSTGLLIEIERSAVPRLGTPFQALVCDSTGQSSTQGWAQSNTFPVALATGDTWRILTATVTDTSMDIMAGSSLSLFVLDEFAPAYCLAKKAADQTGADYSTPTVIAWDGTDITDTHNLHDPASNNSKIIIPTALDGCWVIARANVRLSNVTDQSATSLAIRKGGSISHSTFTGFSAISQRSSFTTCALHVQTHPFQVSEGNQIDTLLYCADTSVDVIAAQSSFGLTVIGR